MGKGGHAAPPEALNFADKRGRQPTSEIPFTIGTLRRAIPPHCFERSVLKSSAYLAVDLVAAALLYWGSTFIDSFPLAARFLLWPAYWFCQVMDPWIMISSCERNVRACIRASVGRLHQHLAGFALLAMWPSVDTRLIGMMRRFLKCELVSCAGCCVHRNMGCCP